MTLALSIIDAADGTGGTATVSGSAGGSANSVYCATFAAGVGALAWTLAGSRTGDGTVAVAPGTGYYLWYLDSLSGGSHAVAPPVYQNLSSGEQSVHYRCLLAVQNLVQALGLAGMNAGQIQITWLDAARCQQLYSLPCVSISPLGREGQPGLLTGLDDIEYPVLVSIEDAGQGDMSLDIPGRTLWRQSIFRCFRHQRLSGVPEIITTDVDPNPVLDERWFVGQDLRFVSSLLFRFRSREPRGFGR
jgi:hypothetical protein